MNGKDQSRYSGWFFPRTERRLCRPGTLRERPRPRETARTHAQSTAAPCRDHHRARHPGRGPERQGPPRAQAEVSRRSGDRGPRPAALLSRAQGAGTPAHTPRNTEYSPELFPPAPATWSEPVCTAAAILPPGKSTLRRPRRPEPGGSRTPGRTYSRDETPSASIRIRIQGKRGSPLREVTAGGNENIRRARGKPTTAALSQRASFRAAGGKDDRPAFPRSVQFTNQTLRFPVWFLVLLSRAAAALDPCRPFPRGPRRPRCRQAPASGTTSRRQTQGPVQLWGGQSRASTCPEGPSHPLPHFPNPQPNRTFLNYSHAKGQKRGGKKDTQNSSPDFPQFYSANIKFLGRMATKHSLSHFRPHLVGV